MYEYLEARLRFLTNYECMKINYIKSQHYTIRNRYKLNIVKSII